MANLSLRNIYKIYPSRDKGPSIFKRIFAKHKVEEPTDFVAVKDFNLEISDGEFVVFVGPSGCGKSTTLRMIAGLEEISAGELYMEGTLLNEVDPMYRDMAMVFQSYALYPHLSAYENIAFGLKMRKIKDIALNEEGQPILEINEKRLKTLEKMIKKEQKNNEKLTKDLENDLGSSKEIKQKAIDRSNKLIDELTQEYKYLSNNKVPREFYRHLTKAEIDEKVQWAASILNIQELLKRKPSEMSGGQCQRVALGRAIVRGPKVFLLDEPLSNLDAKLRTSMRSEIVKLHQKLKTTFVYVTHDQIEAMTMGTKIVVMDKGVIQQVDKPINIFNYPVNMFVAGFIGTPQMNFFKTTLQSKKDHLELTFSNGEKYTLDLSKMRKINDKYLDGEIHEVYLGVRPEHIKFGQENGINTTLSFSEVLGTTTQLYTSLENQDKEIIIQTDENKAWKQGDIIKMNFQEDKIHLFDGESEVSILEGVKEND